MTSTHWLTVAQVAEDLHYTTKTIRNWCIASEKAVRDGRPGDATFPNAKKFPDDKPRSEWRIPEGDLKALSDHRAVQQGPVLTSKERARLMGRYNGHAPTRPTPGHRRSPALAS